MSPDMTDREKEDWLKELFEFELCHGCGGDWDAHVCGPDPLGLPHAWCKNPPPEESFPGMLLQAPPARAEP